MKSWCFIKYTPSYTQWITALPSVLLSCLCFSMLCPFFHPPLVGTDLGCHLSKELWAPHLGMRVALFSILRPLSKLRTVHKQHSWNEKYGEMGNLMKILPICCSGFTSPFSVIVLSMTKLILVDVFNYASHFWQPLLK